MNEQEQDNELRQFFQNRFEDEGTVPPRGLYTQILEKLMLKNSWWKLPIFWVSFSALIIITPIIFLISHKKDKNKIVNNTKNEIEVKKALSKTIDTTTHFISNSKINHDSIKEYELLNNSENKSIDFIKNEKIIKDSINNESLKIKKTNKKNEKSNVKKKKNIFLENRNKKENLEQINKNDNFSDFKTNIQEKDNSTSLKEDEKSTSLKEDENKQTDSDNKKDSINNVVEIKNIKDTIIEKSNVLLNVNDSIKKKSKNYKWALSFSPSLGIQSRIVVPKLNSILQNELVKRKRHHLSCFSLTTDLTYNISTRWSIIGGLYLTQTKGNSRIFEKYIVKKNEDYEISSPDGEIRIDNSELSNNFNNSDSILFKIQLKYKSNQISLPLTFQYLITEKIVQPFFRFGVAMDIETKRLSTIHVTNTENMNQKVFANKTPQLGKSIQGIISIGVQSNFNSRFNTFLELYNGIGLSPYIRQNNYRVRINYHQLRFGVKFSF